MNPDKDFQIFNALVGGSGAEAWGLIMLGLAAATLLIRAAYIMVGHVGLMQASSIKSNDMAIAVFKAVMLIFGGLIFFYAF